MPPLPEGVVILIRRGPRYLFIKRGPNESLPGRWTPVSGAIEPGESQEETAIREAMEEVGLAIQPLRRFHESRSVGGRYALHWWLAEAPRGEARINSDEVADLRWCTLAEARALPDRVEGDEHILALLEVQGALDDAPRTG